MESSFFGAARYKVAEQESAWFVSVYGVRRVYTVQNRGLGHVVVCCHPVGVFFHACANKRCMELLCLQRSSQTIAPFYVCSDVPGPVSGRCVSGCALTCTQL